MKKKTKFTDMPLKMGKPVIDFLPPPSQLVKRDKTVKVTLELTSDSIDFFKQQAAKESIPYQRMLRSLIDLYVGQHVART